MFFSLREYSENNENYIEVPLIFERVIREDLHTDFKCVVINTMSFQTLRTTVKEGMDLGHVRGESYMLNVLWMLNKAAGPPDGYLGGPVSFLWMEHTKQSSHFLWLFWESVAWLGEIILKRKFKVEANFWEKKIAMMLWLTEKKQNKHKQTLTRTPPNSPCPFGVLLGSQDPLCFHDPLRRLACLYPEVEKLHPPKMEDGEGPRTQATLGLKPSISRK